MPIISRWRQPWALTRSVHDIEVPHESMPHGESPHEEMMPADAADS